LAANKYHHRQAYFELATAYYTGVEGVVDEDEVKARELFESAAELGHTGAQV